MRKTLLFAMLLLVSAPLLAQNLFDVIPDIVKTRRAKAMSVLQEGVLSEERVAVHRQAVEANEFDLPIGGVNYTVLQDSVEYRFGGDVSASFRVEDASGLSVFTTYAGYVAATIYLPDGRVFKIDSDKDKGQVLREVDMNHRFACNAVPVSEAIAVVPSRHRAVGPSASPVINTVEFVTQEAQALVGGLVLARAKIQLAVDAMNVYMKQSNANGASPFTLRLADVRSFNVPEAQLTSLADFANNADVVKARMELRALAGLWTGINTSQAYVAMGGNFTFGTGIHQLGINIPWYDITFSHEVGHNFGLQHDAKNATILANDPYLFARGWQYCDPSGPWMTIMSYGDCPNLSVGQNPVFVPYYSNPDVSIRGVPTGVKDKANNAKMLWIGGPLVWKSLNPVIQQGGN